MTTQASAQSQPSATPLVNAIVDIDGDNFADMDANGNSIAVPYLNAAAFDFGFDAGWQIAAGRQFSNGWGIDARYFDIGWSDSFAMVEPGEFPALGTPFVPLGPVIFPGGDFTQPPLGGAGNIGFRGANDTAGTYASDLQSVEINLRRQMNPWLGFLTGFRYLELAEEISLTYADPDSVFNGERITTQQQIGGLSELFGWQIGADGLLYTNGVLSLTALGKAGVFYNAAESRVDAISTFGNPPPGQPSTFASRSRGSDDATTLLTELALAGNWQPTPWATLQAGYNVLWLQGVALASDQIAVSRITVLDRTNAINTSPVASGGKLFVHGANLSLILRR